MQFNPGRQFDPEAMKRWEHLTNWPGAKEAFSKLNDKEKKILTNLAQHKSLIPPSQEAIDKLSNAGWIIKDTEGEWQIRTKALREFILYKCTPLGEMHLFFRKTPPFILFKHIGAWIHRPGNLCSLGFLFLFIPLIDAILFAYGIKLLRVHSLGEISYSLQNILIVPVFVCSVVFIWLSLTSEKYHRLILILIIPGLFCFSLWLGISWILAVALVMYLSLDLIALYVLYAAYKLIEKPDILSSDPINKFLSILLSEGTWKVKRWPRPKIIVFALLFATGFSFFTYALTPSETLLNVPILIEDKNNDGKDDFIIATLFSPAWLSEGDSGNLLLYLYNSSPQTTTITFNLEPAPGHLLFITPQEGNNCHSVCQIMISANNQTLLQWEIRSMPQNAFITETKWYIRYQICKDPNFCTNSAKDQISIPKLRLGFGLWGVMENQSLVFIVSVVSGVVYALVEIGLSSRMIPFPDKEQPSNDK